MCTIGASPGNLLKQIEIKINLYKRRGMGFGEKDTVGKGTEVREKRMYPGSGEEEEQRQAGSRERERDP